MVERPLPEPTDAPAGSPEKVAILRLRWFSGLSLWHPRDAQYDGQDYTVKYYFVSVFDWNAAVAEQGCVNEP